jgi:hypothetical protein
MAGAGTVQLVETLLPLNVSPKLQLLPSARLPCAMSHAYIEMRHCRLVEALLVVRRPENLSVTCGLQAVVRKCSG